MVKRVARRAAGGAGGAGGAGIQSVQAGNNITVDNTDPENPSLSTPDAVRTLTVGSDMTIDNTDPANLVIDAIVPIKSFTEGDNVTITDLGAGDYRVSSFQPLNEPSVQRIASNLTLPAQVANLIVSTATATDITITLPIATAYPVDANKLFETRIANYSNFDVTINIANGSDFIDSADKIVLKGGQKDTVLLRAFNFPVDGAFPAISGWSLADKVLVTFYARYAGNVDIDDFNSPGVPIAFREGTETDNDSVFELNSANETQINIKTDCTASLSYSSEVDANQFGPVWNIDTYVEIERQSAVIIPEQSRTRTGNFGGEDAFISQQLNIELKEGDILSVYMINNGCQGTHKAATINLSARV